MYGSTHCQSFISDLTTMILLMAYSFMMVNAAVLEDGPLLESSFNSVEDLESSFNIVDSSVEEEEDLESSFNIADSSEEDLERSFNIVDSSVGEEEDNKYIRQVLDTRFSVNDTDLPPGGPMELADGEKITIWSPKFPNAYPNNAHQRWIIKPARGANLYLHCPIIRIRHAAKCKRDKLVVFYGRKMRKGERRCGRINNYRVTFKSTIKVIFRSNDVSTNMGYICDIRAEIPPTTTTTTTSTTSTSTSTTSTTTTTFLPGCPQAPIQSPNPKPVTSCSDLDPEHIGNCLCTECSGQLQLTCDDVCTPCDIDMFSTHDFRIPVNLKLTFTCPYHMSLSGFYGMNGDDVASLTVCVTEFLANVDIAFEVLTNLQAVTYRDCSVQSSSCIYDPCNPGDVCQSIEASEALQTTALQRQQPPITICIPSASLAGVKELYVADICLDLANCPLAIESMEKLCINEASGCTEIIPNSLDFPNLEQVSINTCQGEIKSDTFSIVSPEIKCLDIIIPCTHNLDEKFIALGCLDDETCKQDITVITQFNEKFYKYIPHCPYHEFLLKGFNIRFTELIECRECGNYWLGKIEVHQLSHVHGNCYDSVSDQNYTLQGYFSQFTHPCDFIPLQMC